MCPVPFPSGTKTWFLAPVRSPQLRISASSSVLAACGVTPSRSRPMRYRKWLPRFCRFAGFNPERHPDFGAVVHHVRARRHHADDFAGHVVDQHRLPHHRTPAKCVLPQLVRQDRDARRKWCRLPRCRWRARHVGLPFREQAPVGRLYAERIEQMLVDVCGAHSHRSIAGEEVLLAGRERTNR